MPSHHFHLPLHHTHQQHADARIEPLHHAETFPHDHNSSHKHHHVDTPHPTASTLSYLDSHIPDPRPAINSSHFISKHHNEYKLQHTFRRAKHEASLSVDRPIPELAELPSTATHNQAITPEEHARREAELAADRAAWEQIMAAREAARRRSGADSERWRPTTSELDVAMQESKPDASDSDKDSSPQLSPQ